jgi:hypothetical protein
MKLYLDIANRYIIKEIGGLTNEQQNIYGKLAALLERFKIYFPEIDINETEELLSAGSDSLGTVTFMHYEVDADGRLGIGFLAPSFDIETFMAKSAIYRTALDDELSQVLYKALFTTAAQAAADYPERSYAETLIKEALALSSVQLKNGYNEELLNENRFLQTCSLLTDIYSNYEMLALLQPPESAAVRFKQLRSGNPIMIMDYNVIMHRYGFLERRGLTEKMKQLVKETDQRLLKMLKTIYNKAPTTDSPTGFNEEFISNIKKRFSELQEYIMNGISENVGNSLESYRDPELMKEFLSAFNTFQKNVLTRGAFNRANFDAHYNQFLDSYVNILNYNINVYFPEYADIHGDASIFIAYANESFSTYKDISGNLEGQFRQYFNRYDTLDQFNGELYFFNHGFLFPDSSYAEAQARKIYDLFIKSENYQTLFLKLEHLYFINCNVHHEYTALVVRALADLVKQKNQALDDDKKIVLPDIIRTYNFPLDIVMVGSVNMPPIKENSGVFIDKAAALPPFVHEYFDTFITQLQRTNPSIAPDVISTYKWTSPLGFDPQNTALKEVLLDSGILNEHIVSNVNTADYDDAKQQFNKQTDRIMNLFTKDSPLSSLIKLMSETTLLTSNLQPISYVYEPFETYIDAAKSFIEAMTNVYKKSYSSDIEKARAYCRILGERVRYISASLDPIKNVEKFIGFLGFIIPDNADPSTKTAIKRELMNTLLKQCTVPANYTENNGHETDALMRFYDVDINNYINNSFTYQEKTANLAPLTAQFYREQWQAAAHRHGARAVTSRPQANFSGSLYSDLNFGDNFSDFQTEATEFEENLKNYLAEENDPNRKQAGYRAIEEIRRFRGDAEHMIEAGSFNKTEAHRFYAFAEHLSEALNYYGVIVSFAEGQYTFDYSIEDFEDVVVFLNTIGLYESLGQITLDVIGFFRMRYLKSISQLAKAERFAQMLAEVDQALAPFDLIVTYASILEDITNINKHDENEAFYAAFLIIDTINLTMTLNAIGGGAFGGPLAVVGLAANLTGLILGSFMSIAHIKYASTAQKIDWTIGALFGSNKGEDAAYNDELRQQLEEAAQNTLKKSQYRRIIQPVSCLHYMGYNFNDNEHFPHLDNLNTPACLITFPPFDWDNIKDLDNAQIYKIPRWEIDPDSCMEAEKKPEYLYFNPILYMARSDEEGRSGMAVFLPRGMKQQHIDLSAADDDVTFLINYMPSAVMISTRDSINNKTFTHWPTEYYDAIIPVYLAENHSNVFIIQDDCDTELYKAFMDFDGIGASCGYDTRNYRYLPTSYALYPGQNSPAVLDFSNVSALDENTIDIDLAPPINSLPGLNNFYRIIDMKNTGAHLQLWLIADEETLDFTFVNRVALPQQASCHLHTGDIFITSGGFSQVYASSSAAGSLVFQPGFDDSVILPENKETNTTLTLIL